MLHGGRLSRSSKTGARPSGQNYESGSKSLADERARADSQRPRPYAFPDGEPAVAIGAGLCRAWLAGYPTVHPVPGQFRAAANSSPVEMTDPNEMTFALAVIEAWAAQVGEDRRQRGIAQLRDALRDALQTDG